MNSGLGILNKNHPKTREILIEIGTMVVYFGHLESWVDTLIGWFMPIHNTHAGFKQYTARRLTQYKSLDEKFNLLTRLISRLKDKDKIQKFSIIKSTFGKLKKMRNKIHAQWFIEYGSNSKDRSTYIVNFRPAFKKDKAPDLSKIYEKIDITVLQKTNVEMEELIQEFIRFGFS